jgi:hypothetical protein
MIDFATLQGLTIPEGVVTKIESGGVVLWARSDGGKIVMEAKTVTATTYAGETSYGSEVFLLLDVYPKTNGTVSVTYGGLTKTITDTSGAAEPNAIQVFFGTFNGVSDGVETPATGTLTIEGDYRGVSIGSYASDSKGTAKRCSCIKAIKSLGAIEFIPAEAFYNCGDSSWSDKVYTYLDIPEGVKEIGDAAFDGFSSIKRVSIPSSVERIGENPWRSLYIYVESFTLSDKNANYTLNDNCLIELSTGRLICAPLASVVPDGITSIDNSAYYGNEKISKDLVIPDGVTTIGASAFSSTKIKSLILPASLTDIDGYGFNTSGLESITVLAKTPPKISSSPATFNADAIVTCTVPAGCGEAYKAATGWSSFADRIVEAS